MPHDPTLEMILKTLDLPTAPPPVPETVQDGWAPEDRLCGPRALTAALLLSGLSVLLVCGALWLVWR